MRIHTHENQARLLFHLNGLSVIQITDLPGAPIWEIDTRLLRGRSRMLGAEFRIRWNAIWPEPDDTGEELQAAQRNFLGILER